jgi:sigma-B regulation protein RsbQ
MLQTVISRNNVTVSGPEHGRPLVFAHGFGCDQRMWRHITPAFEDAFRIVLYDHVGSGGSDPSAYTSTRYASLSGYAADLVEICEELDLRDAVLVGHSVSAMICARAAVQAPRRVSGVVMVSPSPRYVDDPASGYVGGFAREDIDGMLEALDANYLGWSSTMAPVIMGNDERPDLGEELTASFCRTDPDIARQFARVTFLSDDRALLPRVPARTLVLQCREDPIAPEAVGEYVDAHLRESRYVLLDATGHVPNMSAPDEVVTAIRRFLA